MSDRDNTMREPRVHLGIIFNDTELTESYLSAEERRSITRSLHL
jgi:hypothetical protein